MGKVADWLRDAFSRNLQPGELPEALEFLFDQGLAICRKDATNYGRPPERWFDDPEGAALMAESESPLQRARTLMKEMARSSSG